MIEGEAPDNTWQLLGAAEGAVAPTEEVVAEGLEAAKRAISDIIDFQSEFLVAARRQAATVRAASALRRRHLADGRGVREGAPRDRDRAREGRARDRASPRSRTAVKAHFLETWGAETFAARQGEISPAWKDLQKKVMRARVIEHGVRLDGRGAKDIRPLHAEIDVLPRAHGSSIFERGDTQVLNVTTLGMLRMTQMIDTLDPEDTKRYIHHYNFPPFSTGEVGRIGSPRRREIGHGALAERALVPVIPSEDEFPYALRLVSDVRRLERLDVDGERVRLDACR